MYSSYYSHSPHYYSSSPSPDRYIIRRRRSGSSWGSSMSSRRWVERNSRGEPILVRRRSRSRYGSGLSSSLADIFTSRPRLRGRSVSEEVRVISDPPATQVIVQSPTPYSMAPDPVVTTVVSNNDQALVSYPPPPFPLVHNPYTNRFVSPGRATGKHTCGACGKFRSPSYHARHPVAPGQTPNPTLCQHCKRVGTSSEDSETLSDLAQNRRRHRRLRRRLSIGSVLDSDSEDDYYRRDRDVRYSHRPRSLSRVEVVRRRRSFSSDSYGSPYNSYGRRYYRSSSFDARPIRVSTIRTRRERSLSLSPPRVVERVRYMDGPSSSITYSRRRGGSRFSSYHADDWEDIEDDRDIGYVSRPRIVRYRSPSPVLRRATSIRRYRSPSPLLRRATSLRRHRSPSPFLRRASSRRFRYSDAPSRVEDIEEIETRTRARSRPPSRSVRVIRVSSDAPTHVRSRSWDSEGDARRVAFVSSPSRGRSKTRETVTVQDSHGRRLRRKSVTNVEDYDDDHYSPPERISDIRRRYRSIEAPSPPPAAPWNPQQRYLATRPHNDTTAEITRALERARLSPSPVRRVLSTTHRRTRSRSRSMSGRKSPLRRRASRSGFVEVAERLSYPEDTVAARRTRRVRVREV